MDAFPRCWLLKRIMRSRVPQSLGQSSHVSSFRPSSSTSVLQRLMPAASFPVTLVSTPYRIIYYFADLFNSDSLTVQSDISSREYHPVQVPLPAKTLKAFKSSLVNKLASIFEVGSWALPGADNRAAFQALLEPLFEVREALRVPMQQTFGPANMEIALVNPDTLFVEEYMEDAFASDSRPLDGTILEEQMMPRKVLCSWGVGLKIQKVSTGEPADVRVMNVLRTPVVLESALEGGRCGKESGGSSGWRWTAIIHIPR